MGCMGRSGDMLICPGRWCVSNLTEGANGNFAGYFVNAWCGRVRPSPAAVFGAIVGAGPVSVVAGLRTGMMGSGSTNERVGGLVMLPPRAHATPDAHWQRPCLNARYP